MKSVDRQIAELLSALTAFKQCINKGDTKAAVVYLEVASQRLETIKEGLETDD